jgi:hypothetical protein
MSSCWGVVVAASAPQPITSVEEARKVSSFTAEPTERSGLLRIETAPQPVAPV